MNCATDESEPCKEATMTLNDRLAELDKKGYFTINDIHLSLGPLSPGERTTLSEVLALYGTRPSWDDFASMWPRIVGGRMSSERPLLHVICQDLEHRLGIAEGILAQPD